MPGPGLNRKGGYPPRIEERMRAETIVFAVATRTPQTLVPKPMLSNGIKIFLKSDLIIYQIWIIHEISNIQHLQSWYSHEIVGKHWNASSKGIRPHSAHGSSSTTLTVNPFCVVFHLNPVVVLLLTESCLDRAH